MASVNRVIVLGNLGRDPEVRHSPTGGVVCNLALATSRNWKDKDTGERREETEWHRVVLYNRLAEIAGEYLRKGRPVYIEGRLRTRKWQDKEEVDRYTTEIIAESMQLIGGRDEQQQPASSPAPAPSAGPAARASAGSASRAAPVPAPADMDDDIPFANPYRGRLAFVV